MSLSETILPHDRSIASVAEGTGEHIERIEPQNANRAAALSDSQLSTRDFPSAPAAGTPNAAQRRSLSELQSQIEPHLKRIGKLLPPWYRLTLVCRYDGTEFGDADIVLTADQLPKVSGVIARFSEKTP